MFRIVFLDHLKQSLTTNVDAFVLFIYFITLGLPAGNEDKSSTNTQNRIGLPNSAQNRFFSLQNL